MKCETPCNRNYLMETFLGSHMLRIQTVKHLSNTQVEPNKSVGMINCQGEGCAWGDNIVEWCDIGLSSSCFGISPPNAHYIVQMLEVLSLSLKCKAPYIGPHNKG